MLKKQKVLIVEDNFVEANDLQIMLARTGYEVCGIARSVVSAQEIIKKEKPGLVLLDIFLKGKLTGVDLARQLKEDNIAFVYLSANSNEEILSHAKTTEPYGFILKPFRERDLLVTLEIAEYRHEHSNETRARRQSELVRSLDKVIKAPAGPEQRLLQAGRIMQPHIPFDCMCITFENAQSINGNIISFMRIGFDEYQTLDADHLAARLRLTRSQLPTVIQASNNVNIPTFMAINDGSQVESEEFERIIGRTLEMKSVLSFPAKLKEEGDCTFHFFSRREENYTTDHLALLKRLQEVLVPEQEPKINEIRLASKADYANKPASVFQSEEAGTNSNNFNGIIGNSHLLLTVFDQIAQVAPFDTSVLLMGETGTGKERIADCIHNLSSRKKKSFIKINCAALPPNLIESELFGHEKGSFTGATDKRVGKFEQASGGTIFLDEIGEMPVDLQVKFLRVLQEKEIERIGGNSPIKIDVRVIAATNRDLEKEVAQGRFRIDLYYRLNVFPILLPALRERVGDIPALVDHFVSVYNKKTGKKITAVSEQVLKRMLNYNWPGNIRELEHLIERCVLLAKGQVIDEISLPIQQTRVLPTYVEFYTKTIHENERDHIIDVLRKCNGKIWGKGGAADVLNVPPTTLKSKMKKLDIDKHHY